MRRALEAGQEYESIPTARDAPDLVLAPSPALLMVCVVEGRRGHGVPTTSMNKGKAEVMM